MKCTQCGGELNTDGFQGVCGGCRRTVKEHFVLGYNLTGWQCPVCKMVYAPWISECHCSMVTYTSSGTK